MSLKVIRFEGVTGTLLMVRGFGVLNCFLGYSSIFELIGSGISTSEVFLKKLSRPAVFAVVWSFGGGGGLVNW